MKITIGEALDLILERCGEREADLYQNDSMTMSILIRWAADLVAVSSHLDEDLEEVLKESRAFRLSLSRGQGDAGSRKLSEDELVHIEEENVKLDSLLKGSGHLS